MITATSIKKLLIAESKVQNQTLRIKGCIRELTLHSVPVSQALSKSYVIAYLVTPAFSMECKSSSEKDVFR